MTEIDIHKYKSFIHDLDTIKEFFSTVLVPLERDEVFYLLCQARKKYSNQIVKDPIIKRNILESNDFERFIKLIMEFSLVAPLRKDHEIYLDRDMSVIYIDINPKSMFKAYKDFKEKIDSQIEQYYVYKNESVESYIKKLRSHLLSSIAKSIGSRKIYTLFDLDTQEEDKFRKLVDYIKEKQMVHTVKWISKTQGGYHFIISATKKEKSVLLEPIYRKNQPNSFIMPELEIKDKEDTRTPICGTFQGGKPVQKISLEIFN